jgi:hypothetical protein
MSKAARVGRMSSIEERSCRGRGVESVRVALLFYAAPGPLLHLETQRDASPDRQGPRQERRLGFVSALMRLGQGWSLALDGNDGLVCNLVIKSSYQC